MRGCKDRNGFSRNFELKRHTKTHHPEDPSVAHEPFYECSICGSGDQWRRRDKYLEHVRKEHQEVEEDEYIETYVTREQRLSLILNPSRSIVRPLRTYEPQHNAIKRSATDSSTTEDAGSSLQTGRLEEGSPFEAIHANDCHQAGLCQRRAVDQVDTDRLSPCSHLGAPDTHHLGMNGSIYNTEGLFASNPSSEEAGIRRKQICEMMDPVPKSASTMQRLDALLLSDDMGGIPADEQSDFSQVRSKDRTGHSNSFERPNSAPLAQVSCLSQRDATIKVSIVHTGRAPAPPNESALEPSDGEKQQSGDASSGGGHAFAGPSGTQPGQANQGWTHHGNSEQSGNEDDTHPTRKGTIQQSPVQGSLGWPCVFHDHINPNQDKYPSCKNRHKSVSFLSPHHASHKHGLEYCLGCLRRFGNAEGQIPHHKKRTCGLYRCVTAGCENYGYFRNSCHRHGKTNQPCHIYHWIQVLAGVQAPHRRLPEDPFASPPAPTPAQDMAARSFAGLPETPTQEFLIPSIASLQENSLDDDKVRELRDFNWILWEQYNNPTETRRRHLENWYEILVEDGSSEQSGRPAVRKLRKLARDLWAEIQVYNETGTHHLDVRDLHRMVHGILGEGQTPSGSFLLSYENVTNESVDPPGLQDYSGFAVSMTDQDMDDLPLFDSSGSQDASEFTASMAYEFTTGTPLLDDLVNIANESLRSPMDLHAASSPASTTRSLSEAGSMTVMEYSDQGLLHMPNVGISDRPYNSMIAAAGKDVSMLD